VKLKGLLARCPPFSKETIMMGHVGKYVLRLLLIPLLELPFNECAQIFSRTVYFRLKEI
jgi:hypothetical protein